jgi:hypothetical protein
MKKLTAKDLEALTKDEDNVKVAWSLFAVKAYVETIRAIVEPEQQRVIEFFKFEYDNSAYSEELKQRHKFEEGPIRSHKDLYRISDEDMNIYMGEMRKFYAEKEFKLDHTDHCPLLVAKSFEIDTRRQLVDYFEPMMGINFDKLLCSPNGLKNVEQYVDLLMQIFGPAVDEYNKKHPFTFDHTQKPSFIN